MVLQKGFFVYDVIVIGAGIGGLTTAALLARHGYKVLVLEGHIEPGGCASSYERKRPDGTRYVFDVGATLFAGFRPGGAHHWVGQKLGLTWPVRPLNPAMQVWLPDARVTRWGDERWITERQRVFGSSHSTESFWRTQERTADIAWRFAARLPHLPIETPADLLQLIPTIRPELALLLPGLFSTVGRELRVRGVLDRRMRAYVDGQLLISAQTTAAQCAWLYGAVALDFARIGAHYAEGGAWSLARTLVDSLTRDGGEIRCRQWVARILTSDGQAVGVETEHGERFEARHVVANTTHWDVARMLGEATPKALNTAIAAAPTGWGACMLYLGVDEAAIPPGLAEHHQIIVDYNQPLGEANSVFISIHPPDDARRAPAGQRAITISTHTDVSRWWRWRKEDPAHYRAEKNAMAERMLQAAIIALPNLSQHIRYRQVGTPVTFQRYTHRHLGMVGGLPQTPRTYGLFSLGLRAAHIRNLLIVGDSTFPGQSTAAVSQSGIRAYLAICSI
ncbi:MAG: NAD(P)/FAD-dependent oxidoreductase [Roseiflexaceae bacterium]|nr:NAD(P)/FAD-dependent oxidoreductase [Roseiflexaceae bacterium]